jgi:hypothetical protein
MNLLQAGVPRRLGLQQDLAGRPSGPEAWAPGDTTVSSFPNAEVLAIAEIYGAMAEIAGSAHGRMLDHDPLVRLEGSQVTCGTLGYKVALREKGVPVIGCWQRFLRE